MTDYSIATQAVPVGGRAVANFDTFDAQVSVDVDSIKADWYDHNGVLLETLTRTVADVSGTDIYGNASTLIDPAGTGTYRAILVMDLTHYTPPAGGLRFSVIFTIVRGVATFVSPPFYFQLVPTTLSISLDTTSITLAVMRQTGIVEDVVVEANDTNPNMSLRSGPVYAILAAYKNGAPITYPTNFTWQVYRANVLAVAAPVVGDTFMFTVQKRSDPYVLDIVGRATRDVVRALKPHYDTDALSTSPSVVELIKGMAIGQLKQDLSQGVALDSAFYRSGRDLYLEMKAALVNVCLGVEDIYDASENPVPRRTGAIAGGKRHADGKFVNRLGLQDRAQQHTGLFIALRPDPILAISRKNLSGVLV